MEQQNNLHSRDYGWVKLGVAFAIGLVIGVQGSANYFLSKSQTFPKPEIPSHGDNGYAGLMNPNQEAQEGRLMEDLGFQSHQTPKQLGGAFFLGKDVDYLVPLDTEAYEARSILTNKLAELPGIEIGKGEKELIVVFDPLCPECHELIRQILSDDPIAKTIKAKLIPANFFATEKSSRIASIYMLTQNSLGKPDVALDYLKSLVQGKPVQMLPISEIPDKIVSDYDKATMAILQTGSRVPLVIFRDKKTKQLELFSGRPELSEIALAGPL